MEDPFGLLQIEAMFLGTINDGIEGDFLMIFIPQAIFDITVIVRF